MSDLQSAFDELELHDQSLALSTEALSALTEFLSEQKEQDDAFSALARAAHKSYQVSDPGSPTTAVGDDDDVAKEDTLDLDAQEPPAVKLSMKLFQEDWQLSQFWYDDATAEALANELLKQANGGMIVCVSAPTTLGVPNPLVLLEVDTRFAVFPEFKLYDYTKPLDVDGLEEGGALRGKAAALALDPPFLNEECFSKAAQTALALSNKDTSILVSTGWTIRAVVEKTLSARMVEFRPRHHQLTNAFRCYVNYTSSDPAFAFDADPEDGDNDFSD